MGRTILLSFTALAAGALFFFAEALFSPVATAVPAFARKTGLACSACHEVWPRLNDFGQLFRDRGYRLERDRDAPVEQDPSYWPITMRTTAGYQWLRNTLVPTGDGTTTTATQTGTFGFTGLDVFAVGTLGDQLSFLITYTPGLTGAGFQLAPSGSDLESAWLGFNDILASPFLNLRVGKHALDLPIDEHRQITLTQGYNVYHFHPQGSAVAFSPGDNQPGIELYGHSELSRVRYSFSLVNERNSTFWSNQVVSNPVVWGHITGQQYLSNPVLASMKAGVFGSVGWHPAASLTLATTTGTPPATTTAPVQGTGFNMKRHMRYGAEAHVMLFSTVNPLTISGVIWGGSEDAALITPATAGGATRDARFVGGFVEGVWTINPRLSLVGRYEKINNTQQGDPTLAGGTGNLTSVTGAIRHTFELTSRTEAALQLELSRVATRAADGTTPETYIGFLVLDFAL
jgi:hypothetical protein